MREVTPSQSGPAPARPATTSETDLAVLQATVGRLERRVKELEAAVSEGVQEPGSQRDGRWRCSKCQCLFGMYDADTDVLRLRYKAAAFYYVHLGAGGWIQAPCQMCGELCSQVDDRPEPEQKSEVQAKELEPPGREGTG